jgi:hypothetical protein
VEWIVGVDNYLKESLSHGKYLEGPGGRAENLEYTASMKTTRGKNYP